MNLLHPESAVAMTEHRREAIRMARVQEEAVIEKCRRSGSARPGYTFAELIGKGSFGRVYKGRQSSNQRVVAIKVIDVDSTDFRAVGDEKDEQINDFNKEIRILRQAQESGAPNLNQMIEALAVHSQLWLVCEHCPGGSVKTLMRATNDALGERYIIIIARELGKALKGLHDAGIMHRDIKAANVLIHEEGSLQLCDFGVATVLDKKTDKRRTFIGTLHWMPPELWDRDPEYSDEVDVWAFGCTLYECAVGKPPNADVREAHQLRSRMRRMNQSMGLPENGHHSAGLRSLVSYTLTPDAATRPSFKDVLEHEYLANTEESHPTTILSELVQTYYGWLYGGGHRASLFMSGGAAAGDTPGSLTTSDDEWNFSASGTFENRMSAVLNIPDLSDLSDFQSKGFGDSTPKARNGTGSEELTAHEQANFEERVRRGADLCNIFDQNRPNYEYVTKTDFIPVEQRRVSDLPLRAMSEERPYSIANQVIDLGDFDSSHYYPANPAKDEKIKLADAATIRANRGNSKLYADTASSDTLTARPSIAPRRATKEFRESGGPPRPRNLTKHKTMEWTFPSAISEALANNDNDDAKPARVEKEETNTVSSLETAAAAKPKKHDTMQWSFPSTMAQMSTTSSFSEQQEYEAQQQQTSLRINPPSLNAPNESPSIDTSRASTRPPSDSSLPGHSYSETLDPFAPDSQSIDDYPSIISRTLDERGVSSFYSLEGVEGREWTDPFHTDGAPVEGIPDIGSETKQQQQEPGATRKQHEVTLPAIHPVDPRALYDQNDYEYDHDHDACDEDEDKNAVKTSILEQEFERLLTEMQGVLGGARAAMGMATAVLDGGRERGRSRQRRRRAGKGGKRGVSGGYGGARRSDESIISTGQYHYPPEEEEEGEDAEVDYGEQNDEGANGARRAESEYDDDGRAKPYNTHVNPDLDPDPDPEIEIKAELEGGLDCIDPGPGLDPAVLFSSSSSFTSSFLDPGRNDDWAGDSITAYDYDNEQEGERRQRDDEANREDEDHDEEEDEDEEEEEGVGDKNEEEEEVGGSTAATTTHAGRK